MSGLKEEGTLFLSDPPFGQKIDLAVEQAELVGNFGECEMRTLPGLLGARHAPLRYDPKAAVGVLSAGANWAQLPR